MEIKVEKILGGEAVNAATGETLFKFDPTITITVTAETTLYDIVERHSKIWSFLYSPLRVPGTIESQLVEIEVSKLEWARHHNTFFYVWGWPGPDYNMYTWDTYGKGWAFTKEEIIKAWEEEI